MLIFEKKGRITPLDDKTNISFCFYVPQGISKLIIDYSYSPKEFEDKEAAIALINERLAKYLGAGHSENAEDYLPVKNLITLSLDENGKYRGAAHRQANQQHHEIAAASASVGFEKGTIESGEWRIVFNVHCCACDVDFEIKVSGEEEE